MPIVASDIQFRLSKAASPGNSGTSTPAASLGGYVSTTVITDATLNNLFDDITGDENAASESEYRCIFVVNNHATLAYQNAVIWVSADVAGGATVALSVDTTAASPIGQSGTPQSKTVANEDTAPATQTFTAYASGSAIDTKARGLALGTINAQQVRAVWIRRTAANSAALNNDGFTLSVSGDSAA